MGHYVLTSETGVFFTTGWQGLSLCVKLSPSDSVFHSVGSCEPGEQQGGPASQDEPRTLPEAFGDPSHF